MNEQLSLTADAIADAQPLCPQCNQPFLPRSGSGGRPQKYCSPECRAAFHAQREQRSSTCDVEDASASTQQPPNRKPTPEHSSPDTAGLDTLDDSLCWVIQYQERIALRVEGETVIIAQGDGPLHHDEEGRIFVERCNLEPLIEALQEIFDGTWRPKAASVPASAALPPPPALSTIATPVKQQPKDDPEESEEEEGNWRDDESRVLNSQPETFLYINKLGQIVIRQIAEVFGDNPWVLFDAERVPAIAQRMTELAREAEAARQRGEFR